MNVKIDEKSKKIVITLDLEAPHPSQSGKTLVIGSSYGIQTTGETYKNKPVKVGVNVFIPKG